MWVSSISEGMKALKWETMTWRLIIIMEKTEAGLKGLCIRGIKTI